MVTRWLIVTLYFFIGINVIRPVLPSPGTSLARSLSNIRQSVVVSISAELDMATKSKAKAYCQGLGLRRIREAADQESRRENVLYGRCHRGAMDHLRRTSVSKRAVVEYAGMIQQAGASYEQGLDMANHMGELGYNMETSFTFIQSLRNNRFFIREGHYRDINIPENIWKTYQNNKYSNINIQNCYNFFGAQNGPNTITIFATYARWYDEENPDFAFLRQQGSPDSVCCRCDEAYWFYYIFTRGYALGENVVRPMVKSLCFSTITKPFSWRSNLLAQMYDEIMRNQTTIRIFVPQHITYKILKEGELIATSRWLTIRDRYDLPYFAIGSTVYQHENDGDVFNLLLTAINNEMTDTMLTAFITGTNNRPAPGVVLNQRRYFRSMRCKNLLLRSMYQRNLQNIWPNYIDSFLPYATSLVTYADTHTYRGGCDAFEPYILRIGHAMAVRRWLPIDLVTIFRYGRRHGHSIRRTASCLDLLDHLEQLLQPQVEDGTFRQDDVSNVVENYAVLIDRNQPDCDDKYEDYIRTPINGMGGPVQLFRTILQGRGIIEMPFMVPLLQIEGQLVPFGSDPTSGERVAHIVDQLELPVSAQASLVDLPDESGPPTGQGTQIEHAQPNQGLTANPGQTVGPSGQLQAVPLIYDRSLPSLPPPTP